MGEGEASVSTTRLEVLVLDDFFSSGSSSLQLGDDEENMMQESLWGLMPPELMETVLLFLPSLSQARFHTVCKRWREVMTSPAFQQQTASIASRRDYSFTPLVLQLNIPAGAALPLEKFKTRVLSHGHLVGVAQLNRNSGRTELRCWVLNLADRAWQEVPRLLCGNRLTGWNMWLEGASEGSGTSGFRLFLILTSSDCDAYLTYGSNTTDSQWQTMRSSVVPCRRHWVSPDPDESARSRGAYVLYSASSRRVWRRDDGGSFEILPDAPFFGLLSSPDLDDVFGYDKLGGVDRPFLLYKLDKRRGEWKCVYYGLPRGLQQHRFQFYIEKAQVFGHMVFIGVRIRIHATKSKFPRSYSRASGGRIYVLAYHNVSGTGYWLRGHLCDFKSGEVSNWDHTALVARRGQAYK